MEVSFVRPDDKHISRDNNGTNDSFTCRFSIRVMIMIMIMLMIMIIIIITISQAPFYADAAATA